MADRIYYVICSDNCKFEGMTKEQIIAAIAEATGKTPTDVDAAFITKIKEQNANTAVKIWVGTSAEFNALTEKDPDTLYYYDDDDYTELSSIVEKVINGTTPVAEAVHAVNADNAANTDFTKSEWSSLVNVVNIKDLVEGGVYQLRRSGNPNASAFFINDRNVGITSIHINTYIEFTTDTNNKYVIKSVQSSYFEIDNNNTIKLIDEYYYLGNYTDYEGSNHEKSNGYFQYRRIR